MFMCDNTTHDTGEPMLKLMHNRAVYLQEVCGIVVFINLVLFLINKYIGGIV
jgi:hypothetical protein